MCNKVCRTYESLKDHIEKNHVEYIQLVVIKGALAKQGIGNLNHQVLNHSAASAPAPSFLGFSSTIEPVESNCEPMSVDELLSGVLNEASLDEPAVDEEAMDEDLNLPAE